MWESNPLRLALKGSAYPYLPIPQTRWVTLESHQRLAIIDRGLDLRANPAWCAVREWNPHLLGVGQLFWAVELPARKIGRGYRSRTCVAALMHPTARKPRASGTPHLAPEWV